MPNPSLRRRGAVAALLVAGLAAAGPAAARSPVLRVDPTQGHQRIVVGGVVVGADGAARPGSVPRLRAVFGPLSCPATMDPVLVGRGIDFLLEVGPEQPCSDEALVIGTDLDGRGMTARTPIGNIRIGMRFADLDRRLRRKAVVLQGPEATGATWWGIYGKPDPCAPRRIATYGLLIVFTNERGRVVGVSAQLDSAELC